MHLDPSPEQVAVSESFGALFAKESPIERVRAVEVGGGDPGAAGFDQRLWVRLGEAGVPALAAPGGGASLLDQVLVCEQAGRVLAPVPLPEALVAARLVGQGEGGGGGEGGGEGAGAGAGGAAGRAAPLVVWSPRPVEADGWARLVPGGAVADVVVAVTAEGRLVQGGGPLPGQAAPTLGRGPVADRDLSEAVGVPGVAADAARDARLAWCALAAARLAGVAERALELGVEHARERVQFGAPIGSFQAVQQALADVAPLVPGARDLARKAAWSLDAGHPRADELALAAFLAAGEAARRAAGTSLHVHGGYGFAEEGDISLYFRRATAWSLALADPRHLRAELARLRAGRVGHDLVAEAGWAPPADQDGQAGLEYGPHAGAEAVRAEVRAFLHEHLGPDVVERAHQTGTMHDWDLHRALAEAGWLAAAWPAEHGGAGRDPFEVAALQEELRRQGAPTDGWGTTELVANVVREVGTPEQQEQVIGPALAGELLIALGYSEPEAGSDVASVATRAVLADDGSGDWVITGQKMFTTLAHEAHLVFLLARTNPDVAKHRGLTLFLVPMDAPGVEVTPLPTLGGERTNVTFYDEVRVPASAVVGEVDGGWDVMKVALAFERQPSSLHELARLQERYEAWAAGQAEGEPSAGVLEDPLVAERLGRVAVEVEVGRVLADRMTWVTHSGALPIAEGSLAKLYTSEVFQASAADLLDALGPEGRRDHVDPAAPLAGWAEHAHRHAQVVTIYAGTSEIQRSIIAERHLGLPRSR